MRTRSPSRPFAQLDRERSGVDLRQLEHVVDEKRQRAHLLVQRGDVVVRCDEPVLGRFEHGPHVRERCAKIVAGPGDELPARVEQPLDVAGHLVERRRELCDLARPVLAAPCAGEIASRELRRRLAHPLERTHHRLGEEQPATTAIAAAVADTARIFTSSPMWNITQPESSTEASGRPTASAASAASWTRTVGNERSTEARTRPDCQRRDCDGEAVEDHGASL